MTLRIGLLGTGRLGSLVETAVAASDQVELTWAVGHQGPPATPVDVAIDVSSAAAVPEHLQWAQSTQTNIVLGVTGWDSKLVTDLGATTKIGVLIAPNFSLSVALIHRMSAVLGRYAAQLGPDVDLAITDTHHRAKADAPSGTAASLRRSVSVAADRPESAIQTTSLRVGGIVGAHTVRLDSDVETLEVTHTAHDRRLFADGALRAAQWLQGKTGVFDLDDWADAELAYLFAPQHKH